MFISGIFSEVKKRRIYKEKLDTIICLMATSKPPPIHGKKTVFETENLSPPKPIINEWMELKNRYLIEWSMRKMTINKVSDFAS